MKHRDYGLDLVTAEMPTILVPEIIQIYLGVAFNPNLFDSEKVKMIYTSLRKKYKIPNYMTRMLLIHEAEKGLRQYGDRFGLGIGCLTTGIFGNEPVMTLDEFEHDLQTAKHIGISKIFIYRLGGITQDTASIMKAYTN